MPISILAVMTVVGLCLTAAIMLKQARSSQTTRDPVFCEPPGAHRCHKSRCTGPAEPLPVCVAMQQLTY